MPTNLTAEQLARVLKTSPPVTENSPVNDLYDTSLDSVIEGMFGRVWDEYETFPPGATDIWSLLVGSFVLGDYPDFADVPLLISIAEVTTSETLRHKALVVLRMHLSDISGADCSLKPRVKEVIAQLTERNKHA
jgi:hypothetical protein